MKRIENVYQGRGNAEELCDDLRKVGFGVPQCWNSACPNDIYRTQYIYPNPDAINTRMNADGNIIEEEIIGDIEVERGKENVSSILSLTVYIGRDGPKNLQNRARDLDKFVSRYNI